MNSENAQSQMRKGILEYCTLQLLSKQDMYASDIIQQLKDAKMIVVEGTLYPLLMRQKNAGLLSYRWEESTQGPPRKYYTITEAGKEFLCELDTAWTELIKTVDTLRNKTINKPNQ
jgi:PadR family transcriptional regulator, regulatory protein PadR